MFSEICFIGMSALDLLQEFNAWVLMSQTKSRTRLRAISIVGSVDRLEESVSMLLIGDGGI